MMIEDEKEQGWEFEKPVPPPAREFEKTSVDDLIAIAAALLADPEMRPILDRVGVHGDLTEDEWAAIEKSIAKFSKAQRWGYRDSWMLDSVATALARKVAAGEIADVNGEAAKEFVVDRKFDRPTDRDGLRSNNVFASEVILFAKALLNNPITREICFKAHSGAYVIEDETQKLRTFEWLFKRKYGLFGRFGLVAAYGVIHAVFRGELESLDQPDIEAKARKYMHPTLFLREGR